MRKITKEDVDMAILNGWSEDDIKRGYAICQSDGEYVEGATMIQRIDDLMKFDDDHEASTQAEKDGIKIIHDLPDGIPECDGIAYLDTPDNRKTISEFLFKKYRIIWGDREKKEMKELFH